MRRKQTNVKDIENRIKKGLTPTVVQVTWLMERLDDNHILMDRLDDLAYTVETLEDKIKDSQKAVSLFEALSGVDLFIYSREEFQKETLIKAQQMVEEVGVEKFAATYGIKKEKGK